MHETSKQTTNIPAFLAKLWKLVNDPETDEFITWSSGGNSFIITNPAQFQQELLPMYYKHNNMASFIRQLNMYGFHKVVSVDTGGLKSDRDVMEFAHACFTKGVPYLMTHIKRKMPTTKLSMQQQSSEELEIKGIERQNLILGRILNDVNTLKSKQATWDAKLLAMKRENETLWRELAVFRQKHMKQEEIINKLIQFIVTMVQPTARNVPYKRRIPLMINDTSRSCNKDSFTSRLQASLRDLSQIKNIREFDSGRRYRAGPTILEIDPMEDSVVVDDEADEELTDANVVEGEELVDYDGLGNSSTLSYDVLSPESLTCQQAGSSPFSVESESTVDLNPMTPVNPVVVNPAVVPVSSKSLTVTGKNNKSLAKKQVGKRARRKLVTKRNTKSLQKYIHDALKNYFKERDDRGKVVEKNIAKPLIDEDLLIFPQSDLLSKAQSTQREVKNEAEQPPVEAESLQEGLLIGKNAATSSDLVVMKSDPADNNDQATSTDLLQSVNKDLMSHVDAVQSDLDVLKDFLKAENLTLDANTLLELFNEDPLLLNMPPAGNYDGEQAGNQSQEETSALGNELIQYGGPSLMDLVDLYTTEPKRTPSPTQLDLQTPLGTPKPARSSPFAVPPRKKVKKN